MANREQLEILRQGADVWNKWRKENPEIHFADLSKTNLMEAHLRGADLDNVDLRDTDLSSADLSIASLVDADLTRANLSQAILEAAELYSADLTGANLTEANLFEANLGRAVLHGANLEKAIVGFTVFGDIDLSDTLKLEEVVHRSSSTIGTDTIQRSYGKIPEVFLRGCGLSDLQIEIAKLAAPSLNPEQVTDITYRIHQLYLGGGIQYYSCFISYSSKDQEFAQRLHDDLQNNGVRCWFDREDLKIGYPIRPTIDRQIRLHDKLLVILSENSIKSGWVGDEVEGAIEEESKSNRLVLFPIRLDDTVMTIRDDWAAKIKRRRHIGDFSNWKDKSSYQKALERLLRDLKATDGGSVTNK